MANVGGYDLEFLESPPDDYECPVCQLVLKDPQIVDCCGIKYCLGCIERVMLANKPCPICQGVEFKIMPEKQLMRRISDLKVKCAKMKLGCKWTGELRELQNHLDKVCPYIEVLCPLNCGGTFIRSSLQTHEEDDCPMRTSEIKLLSFTRKLESRIEALELKCAKQDDEIATLTKELHQVKEEKEKQDVKIKCLDDSLNQKSSTQDAQFSHSLRVIEEELIRRCFSFPVRVTTNSSSWISPPFYTHHKGYSLQLTARLCEFSSMFDNLAYSFLFSGRSVEKSPIKLFLNILPQHEDEANLDWPVHVTVDILVFSNTDEDSNGKFYTITKYKESVRNDRGRLDEDKEVGHVIGHAQFCFVCQLVIVNIRYGIDPPLLEADNQIAAEDGRLAH